MSPTGFAIVTGGGSGIGREFCHTLAGQNWTVAVVDCSSESASAVAEEITSGGGQAIAEVMDVASAQAWRELHNRLTSRWPRLDLLVNCAGNLLVGTVDECTAAELQHTVEVNLLGTMYGCQSMTPWLRESRSGASPRGVINVASIFAAVCPPGFSAYNATKAGVLAFTETIRGELKPFGLNATAVIPGITPTRLFLRARFTSEHHAELCRQFVENSELTASAVAEQALSGARRGKLHVVVGGRAKWYSRLKRLAPQKLIDRVAKRAVEEFGILRGAGKAADSQVHRAQPRSQTVPPTASPQDNAQQPLLPQDG